MIHEVYNKSEIAKRYYDKLGKSLTKSAAQKQFEKETRIRRDVLQKLFVELYYESLDVLWQKQPKPEKGLK